MSLREAQAKVREFHVKFGCLAPDGPRMPERKFPQVGPVYQRAIWIDGELSELFGAERDHDFPGIVDAYLDILYFALGGLVECGVDASPLFDAIHAANMAKIKIPGQAKIGKPEGWTPPDIAGLLKAQGWRP